MNWKSCFACVGMFLATVSVSAQTTVTTSGGTTNSLPVYTGSSTLGSSIITQSDGDIGIGLNNPSVPLDVKGYLHVSGNINPSTTVQGAYLGWNALTGGYGETDFINNPGGGYGGFAFMDVPSSGSPRTTLMFINGVNGNVGVGTTNPGNPLDVYTRGGGSPIGAMSIDVGTFGTSSNASKSYFFRVRDIGGSATDFQIQGNGDVGIGTTSPTEKLEVDGNIKLTAGSGGYIEFPDGSEQTTAYKGVACGGDYAEAVDVTGNRRHYGPGDLLVLDPKHPGNVLKSATAYSTSIAGIYSTKPGYVGRRMKGPKGPNEVPMAMVGIVPTHVTTQNGPIHVGDLLVSSSTPGYAMRGTDRGRMLGAVVGKAMGNLASGKGEIEVLVTLQ